MPVDVQSLGADWLVASSVLARFGERRMGWGVPFRACGRMSVVAFSVWSVPLRGVHFCFAEMKSVVLMFPLLIFEMESEIFATGE